MSAISTEYHDAPSTAPRTRVLIADDHPLILAGIRRTLDRGEGVEVVGEANCGPQVLALIERRRPEVVLLDLHMPGVDGHELIETIRREWPEIKIVVLSANEDRSSVEGSLRAGASAYILKSVNPVDLPSLIRQVAGGAVFLPRRAAGQALEDGDSCPELTERERTILSAISSGATTSAISRELWVSEHTIKFHLTNIYRKLGVSNRAGAVRFALEHGLAA
jgi:DNA-binding NarL/FixJ family response regulator